MTAAHFRIALHPVFDQVPIQLRAILLLTGPGCLAQLDIPVGNRQHVVVRILLAETVKTAARKLFPAYIGRSFDDSGPNRVAVEVEHQVLQLFVVLDLERLGPTMGQLAQPIVTLVVHQAEIAVGPAHVITVGLEIIQDFAGLVTMITHDIVAVDCEIVPRALLQVIVMHNLEIGVFFTVLAKQELTVVAAPDLVEHRTRAQNMFSWNSHAER